MTDPIVTDDPALGEILTLLDDEHARSILAATSAEPLSAAELGDHFDVSVSTIYRRVNRLEEADLVTERTRPRPDGHHETVYVATLDRFELAVRDGEIDWTIDRPGTDIADELTRLWGRF